MDVKQVGAHTQEIRIATAMTGGVSLAIWMGGVARELNLLQQAAWRRYPRRLRQEAQETFEPVLGVATSCDGKVRDLYVRLLCLLDLTVSVDMLSGTSAGGINGALLGLARANSLDLGDLRKFWLKSGAFDTLLRDPKETKPPSLLQGDGVLFKELLDGIRKLKPADLHFRSPALPPEAEAKTKVFITTTLLTGETSRFTDSLGTLVQDVDRRGLFIFDETHLTSPDRHDLVALAARCSASYPGAFEPAFVPFEKEIPASGTKVLRHPAMKEYANITRDHWVADGGLLANRPIGPLLQSIFDSPAERQARRVLLYVVPSPGETPDPREVPSETESFDAPWTLGEALLKDLGSVVGQSIRADLTALRRHNDRVDSIRDTRLRLAEIGARRRFIGPLSTRGMLTDYRAREAVWLVRPVIASLMRAVTTMPKALMPEAWLGALEAGRSAEQECRAAAAAAVSRGWVPPIEPPAFGRPAFDGAKATVLTMLRAAYICRPNDWTVLSALTRKTHEAFVASARPDTDLLVEAKLRYLRGTPSGGWPSLPQVADEVAMSYEVQLRAPANPSGSSFEVGWEQLAGIVGELAELIGDLDTLISEGGGPPPVTVDPFLRPTAAERRQRASHALHHYLKFLTQNPRTAQYRLLDLHIATRSVLPVGVDVEQPVELIQVSADTRTVLAPQHVRAADKLTGRQFHNFGAFYKPSWRANDWAWGRLDGAGWLVHMLLDPRRILELAERSHVPQGARCDWFYEELQQKVLDGMQPEGWPVQRPGEPEILLTDDEVRKELNYLDDPDAAVPAGLPLTSLWVALRWQQWIAANELPVVAEHMLSTPATRHDSWAREVLSEAGSLDRALAAAHAASSSVMTRNWSRQQRKLIDDAPVPGAAVTLPNAEAVAAKLATCPVPNETFAQELGQPLFTRTVTKALATATGALTGVKEPPASVKPFFSSARTATMVGYRAAGLTGGSPLWLTIGALICFGVAAGLMSMEDTLLGLTSGVLLVVGCLLFGLAAWGVSRRLLPAAGAVLLAAGVWAASTVKRDDLFGKATDSDAEKNVGWVGETVLPWLQASPWRPLIALGGAIALSLVISGAVVKLARIVRRG
ncbi:patatin-like protein [Streptomyces sp. NBC_00162]|uniref:patatin-like protein n=1 Tax=Streptomyces sp. NBC_00162 TaxID=2903629 RepID=UPI00214AFA87|nr:patatin-like protein [Streptomyces sp. NBC_00162]UUU45107.1 patatin-like protein [Streptomyces sp. NBC_00162]